jgi:hypothetical protein
VPASKTLVFHRQDGVDRVIVQLFYGDIGCPWPVDAFPGHDQKLLFVGEDVLQNGAPQLVYLIFV